MTFINARLPTQVELNAQRIDEEDIEEVETDGGYVIRNARQAQSLLRFEISFPAGREGNEIREAVVAMYKAARGPLRAFRFRDFIDHTLADELIGTGDGTTTAFQIKKTWTVGGVSESRNITRPVSSPAITVKRDGVTVGSGYSINYATGILTFSVAPLAGVEITVSGEYDIPVRFASALNMTALTGQLAHIDSVTLVEERE